MKNFFKILFWKQPNQPDLETTWVVIAIIIAAISFTFVCSGIIAYIIKISQ
jgi:hypothetical protein